MEAEAGRIAHCKDKGLAAGAVAVKGKVVGLVDDFVEEGDHVNRVACRTGAGVIGANGVSHVGLVIRSVEVDAVPA